MFFSIINNLLMNEFANSTHKPSSEEAISIASALFGPTVTVSVVSLSATGLGTLDRKLAAIKTRDSTWHQELHFYTTSLASRQTINSTLPLNLRIKRLFLKMKS